MAEQATGYVPRDYASHPVGSGPHEFEWDESKFPLMTLKEACEKSADDIAKGLDPLSVAMNRNAMPTYQNGHPLCWAHALTMADKINRAKNGQPIDRTSATALGLMTTGGRVRGGNCFEAMPTANTIGIPSVDQWAENDTSMRNDTPAMRADAKLRRIVEWWVLPAGSDQHKWTALANRFALWCGYSNIGHAICGARLDPNPNQPTSLDINSWSKSAANATRWEESWLGNRDVVWTRKGRDFRCFECYAVRTTTIAA